MFLPDLVKQMLFRTTFQKLFYFLVLSRKNIVWSEQLVQHSVGEVVVLYSMATNPPTTYVFKAVIGANGALRTWKRPITSLRYFGASSA